MLIYTDTHGVKVIVAEEFTTDDVERIILATAAEPDPLRAYFAHQRDVERDWLARSTPEQIGIGYGAHVKRQYRTAKDGEFTIYGTITPLSVLERAERSHGASDAEIDALMHRIVDGYLRGWRYGEWWSAPYPDGEHGAHHVVDLTAISAGEFDAARWRRWRAEQ